MGMRAGRPRRCRINPNRLPRAAFRSNDRGGYARCHMNWVSVLLLAAARVTITLQLQTVGLLTNDFEHQFSLDSASIGLLLGLYLDPGVLVALPAGYLGSFASEKAAGNRCERGTPYQA